MALDAINRKWKQRLDTARAGSFITVHGSNLAKIDGKFWKSGKGEFKDAKCSTVARKAIELRLSLGVIGAKLYGPKTKGGYVCVKVKRRCGSPPKVVRDGVDRHPVVKRPRERGGRTRPPR
jgi:hypothetical protein